MQVGFYFLKPCADVLTEGTCVKVSSCSQAGGFLQTQFSSLSGDELQRLFIGYSSGL